MANNQHIQSVASEFSGDEKKLIEKIASEKTPNFKPNEEFKSKLDSKIQDKIILTQQQKQAQAELDAVPKKLKWRFYLTGYGYAIVSFIALFLIGFCTNIFTGRLNIQSKYTYLDEDKAFGELAYNYDANRASNFYYDSMDNDYYEYEEISDESDLDTSSSSIVNTNSSISKMIETQALGATMASAENFMTTNEVGEEYSRDYLLSADSFTYNQTYRFAYKNKLFPKLNEEYPVYKASGILMGTNTPNQALKNLKIGNISFKNFQDLDIMNIEMEQSVENGYNITFDNRNMKLYLFPNSSWKASEYLEKLPSKKQILKNVEKDLKSIGVSLKNYGEGNLNVDDFDEGMGIVQVFYPFLINGKSVRSPETDQQIGMQIAYDLNLQKVVSVIGMDIATYDVSSYPIIDKSIIESEIEKGGEFYNQGALHENSTVVLFDSMEVVYIEKTLYDDTARTIYIPAIRATVSTSIESYAGPSVVYQEII